MRQPHLHDEAVSPVHNHTEDCETIQTQKEDQQMPDIWTINNGDVAGGKDGTDLVGCHIVKNALGTGYEFTKPSIDDILATTTGNSLPTAPFDFPQFTYKGYNWNIHVGSLSGSFSGTWQNNDPQIADDETGTWTAQAGAGADDEEDASAASA
jgi:hypothetical protein